MSADGAAPVAGSEAAAEVKSVADVHPLQSKADEANKARGVEKGTRIFVGYTRGRNTQPISFENFDEKKPDTLPKSIEEFLKLTSIDVNDETRIVGLLVDGYNAEQYTLASDPIAEFINPAWSADTQKSFRMAVRSYASATGSSIDDAVAIIKPGLDKAHAKANA